MRRMLVLAVAIVVVVAACGDTADNEPSEPAETTATAAPATTTTTTTTAAPTTTTAAPTTTTSAAATIVPGEDSEVDAVVLAYTVAFDSTSDYAAKAPYIEDPSGLEETVVGYLDIGETMGGVGVVVTSVTIEGEEAQVGYDLLFNDNPTYPNLSGTAVLTEEGWKVPRDVFCGLMQSARVGCPSE